MRISKPRTLRFSTSFFKRFSYFGLVGAVCAFCVSFLPSLLPRPWLFQGIITGVSLAVGYGMGCLVSWALRWFLEWEPPQKFKTIAWWLLAVVGPIAGLAYLFLSASWQAEVSRLVGEQPQDHRYVFRILAVSVVVGLVLLYGARLVRYLTRLLINLIDRLLPKKVSIVLGIIIITYVLITIFNGLFFRSFVRFANKGYGQRNNSTARGIAQPTDPGRSGSPESLVAWETLGYQGRNFVARGPSRPQLTAFSGGVVKTPIRIYAGLQSAPDPSARAELAVRELERTNAFERKVLIIANATGTGWLEPQAMDSVEYMNGGDTAIVSMQYSYLPSWLSFLVNKQDAKDAGQALFNAVYGKWATLPEDSRPKLITYGLSLGSYSAQSAFSGANDLKYTTDGALFVGTPSTTDLWKTITSNRDAGSPQIDPEYDRGASIRFVDSANDFNEPTTNWKRPRTLYLQHPSDPVIWFDFDLIFNKPDWLKEPRGADVSPQMNWYPFVTFTQVALDQFLGVTAPVGHGHNYGDKMVSAWAEVLAPDKWSQTKTDQLQRIIDTYVIE